jgi:hypothetical protein
MGDYDSCQRREPSAYRCMETCVWICFDSACGQGTLIARNFCMGEYDELLQDPEVYAVWWPIFHGLAPPTDLLSPKIFLKLAWMQLQSCLAL